MVVHLKEQVRWRSILKQIDIFYQDLVFSNYNKYYWIDLFSIYYINVGVYIHFPQFSVKVKSTVECRPGKPSR